MTNQDKRIEECLDNSFGESSLYNSWDGCREDLIRFIKKLLQSQREEIISKIEKLKKKPIKVFGDEDFTDGYNQALSDLIQLLTDKK